MNRMFALLLLTITTTVLSPALLMPTAAAEPFEIRGWDIERFDPQYVIEMIHKAKAAGMNTISLSHEVVMNAEEIILDWHRYKHLRRFCDAAHALDMKVYLWNHQINNPPPELIVAAANADERPKLRLDEPKLWEWLDDRYERVVQRVPNLDGIILSLTESQFQIHRENEAITTMTMDQRMAKLINTVHGALARHDKQLIVRDFLRYPPEMAAFEKAMTQVPDEVWVYTKCVPNDWEYRYPPHPLLGKLAPHKQIMELDVFNETSGSRLTMPAVEYYRDQLTLARKHGLTGAIARVDDGFATNVGTPDEFNVWGYSKLLNDLDTNVDTMKQTWYTAFYGPKAAPVAIECLNECFDIVCAIRYTLGFWTGDYRATAAYADGHLIRNTSTLWSDDPKYARIEKMLYESGAETVAAVVQEKHTAYETALQCVTKLEAAKPHFAPDKYTQLRTYFLNAARDAELGEAWVRTYFAWRWYRNTPSAEANDELEAALQACREIVTASKRKKQSCGAIPQLIIEIETARPGLTR